MRKILHISVLCALCSVLFAPLAHAICPVCTIAVGAGLEGMRLLGVDDVITGLWAGALTVSLIFWTAGYMNKKGVRSAGWYAIMALVYYALLAGVYLLPDVHFGACALWGVDKFLLGIIVGSIAFWIGAKWHASIKKNNGGKSKFPFQKVIMPISLVIVATIFFALVLGNHFFCDCAQCMMK